MRVSRFLVPVFLFLASVPGVFAADFPFSDVSTGDPIYQGLKTLYGRGVIDTPTDGKFHPEALMDRDEFTSIAIGVGCRKCLTPTFEDILKYRSAPFLDFPIQSPYFYCVSYAKDQSIVQGYDIPGTSGYACQDGKTWNGIPFCAKNRISRIEAAAVLLRQAGLWDEAKNVAPYQKRIQISDVSDYWYGYAQKGVDAGILSVGSDGKLRPDEYLSKREFVRMAALIFSLNLCEAKGMGQAPDAFASEIRVMDSAPKCRLDADKSTLSSPVTSYNFGGLPDMDGASYQWIFTPAGGSGTLTAEGKCLSDFKLPVGDWVAKLTVTAKDGRSSVSYATVPSRAPSDVAPLSVAIEAVPLQSPAGIAINFYSTVGGGKGPYAYRWDLGDGTVSNGSDPVYAYGQSGIYPVTLVVTDSLGQRAAAKLVVAVSENPDIDGDGVPNGDDSCPTVYGPKSNKGCPVVPEYSSTSGKGPFRNGAALTIDSVGSKCLLSTAAGSGAIFATALACTTCPCSCDLDFVSQIRRCDILFPTILSPDKKTIYGRGPVYEVQ